MQPKRDVNTNKHREIEAYMQTHTTRAYIPWHAHRKTQIHTDSHKTRTTKASMWAMNLLCFETKAQLKQRQDQREREQSCGLNTVCLT